MATTRRHADTDKGWSWCVLAASYMNQLLCAGLAFIAGMFQVIFLQEFQESVALTSWVTSLFSSLLQLAGPLSSLIANGFGCRTSVMLGGLSLSLGFLVSGLINSIGALMVTFGLMAGVGMGLTYTSSIVVVSFYFDKRRHLANGIASSAGGLGILLAPQISQVLFEHFSWREALFILAGISLQIIPCGALMFPVHEKPGCVSLSQLCGKENDLCPSDTANNQNGSRLPQIPTAANLKETNENAEAELQDLAYVIEDESHSLVLSSCIEAHDKTKSSLQTHSSHYSDAVNGNLNHQKPFIDDDGLSKKSLSASSPTLTADFVEETTSATNYHKLSPQSYREHEMEQFILVEKFDQDLSPSKKLTPSSNRKLYQNSAFLVLCLALMITNAGCAIFLIHVPSFFKSEGLDERETSNVLSMNGLAILFGRCIVGAVANKYPNSEVFFIIAMNLIGGVILCLFPLLATSFVASMFIMFFTAFFNGSMYVVLPTLTIRFVGLHRLTTAFGLEMVCCGAGFLISPPIAGVVVDWTHSYDYNMYFGGLLIIFAGLVMSLLPRLEKRNL